LYDVGKQDGDTFLVMEYLEGETLTSRLKSGPLPLPEALQHGVALADAVAFAHDAGLIHRDIKPSNIILTAAGPKLLDFGLAKLHPFGGPRVETATADMISKEDMIVGTLAYMSPEQLEGMPADRRSDVFSLGLVLYEMVAGRRVLAASAGNGLAGAIAGQNLPRIRTCDRRRRQSSNMWCTRASRKTRRIDGRTRAISCAR
jgi:eukaryotic-like serine/threonine-protein kinase